MALLDEPRARLVRSTPAPCSVRSGARSPTCSTSRGERSRCSCAAATRFVRFEPGPADGRVQAIEPATVELDDPCTRAVDALGPAIDGRRRSGSSSRSSPATPPRACSTSASAPRAGDRRRRGRAGADPRQPGRRRARERGAVPHHRRQAITDGLTGLYNHRYFYERLEQEVGEAQRYGSRSRCS